MQKINIRNNISDIRKKLFKSIMSILLISVFAYMGLLLSIVVTAIDYKHISSKNVNLSKDTVNIERQYAQKVNNIKEKQIYTMGYEKVNSSFVVRKDSEANFSLLYGY